MNTTYSDMNPYFYSMATDATNYINSTTQDFFLNHWPMMMMKMDYLWNRLQSDRQTWIAMYPLSLFVMAALIWMTSTLTRNQSEMDLYTNQETTYTQVFEYNGKVRQRRVLLMGPMKRKDDHPMIRRSEGSRMFICLE